MRPKKVQNFLSFFCLCQNKVVHLLFFKAARRPKASFYLWKFGSWRIERYLCGEIDAAPEPYQKEYGTSDIEITPGEILTGLIRRAYENKI